MVEDVRLAVEGRCPVAFHGRMGGMVPTPDEVVGALKALSGKVERTREREREQQQKRHSGRVEGQTGGHHRAAEDAHLERTQGAEVDGRAGARDGGER
jgi:NADH:ubiquinone oxidoreductase subunit B-like Fe-S oxidoreductase